MLRSNEKKKNASLGKKLLRQTTDYARFLYIMHTAIVQRKQKAVCQRTAKFIDKLKPCKYSLTNRELKKQIFNNLEHTNQIERATEIPLRP